MSDYLGVGGLTATLLNVWLTTWLSITVLYLIKARFNGVALAGVLTIAGFAFLERTSGILCQFGSIFYLCQNQEGTIE
jgi:hypothetical protein